MPDALSDQELLELEALAAAALPGPWRSDPLTGTMVLDDLGREIVSCLAYPADALPTGEFIAQCRVAVPALVAEVRRWRRRYGEGPDGSAAP